MLSTYHFSINQRIIAKPIVLTLSYMFDAKILRMLKKVDVMQFTGFYSLPLATYVTLVAVLLSALPATTYAATSKKHSALANKKHAIHVRAPQTLTVSGERLQQLEQLASQQQLAKAQALLQSFQQTPLAAYAQYIYLKSAFPEGQLPTAEMMNYLQHYGDTSWANILAQRWFDQLAQQQDWTTLVLNEDTFSRGDARCAVLSAQYQTGFYQQPSWLAEVSQRWLADAQPSQVCSNLYSTLESTRWLSADIWRKKLDQWYAQGELDEANKRQDHLPDALLAYHLNMNQQLTGNIAEHVSALIAQPLDIEQQAMLKILMQRLIIQNAPQAEALWLQVKPHLALSTTELNQLEKQLYRQLAKVEPEKKLYWLAQINPQAHDEHTLLPLLQEALKASNWSELVKLTDYLPTALDKDTWHYWRAKALTQLGENTLAQPIWESLAKERSYYGFMAADYLGTPYQLNTQYVSKAQLEHAHNTALAQRLQALYEAGLKSEAWKEWNYARNQQYVLADDVPGYAQLAQSWGWYAFSVLSLGKPEHWNYTQLRFFTPYQDLLVPNAEHNDISPAWAYGIMRRESAYASDVKSSSGAMGLMQLMPKTAQALAPIKHLQDVYQPELNVQLGTKLLGQLKRQFNDNLVLATAAYNAGAFRVKQWLKNQPMVPTDQWIELIPFKETREYVKAVIEYTLVFERSGLSTTHNRLADYLQPMNVQLASAGKQCDPNKEWCL